MIPQEDIDQLRDYMENSEPKDWLKPDQVLPVQRVKGGSWDYIPEEDVAVLASRKFTAGQIEDLG